MRRRNSGGLKTPLIFCILAVVVASFSLNFFHPSLVPSASAKLSDTLCHSLSGCSKDGYVAYLADPNGEAVEYGSTPFRVFLGSGSETYINIDNQDGLVGITFSDTAGGSGPGYTVTPLTGNLSGYKLYIFKASSTLDYTGDEFGTAASTISKLQNKGIDPVATYSLSENTRTILATKDGNSFKFVATSASGETTEEIVTEEESSSGSSSEAEADTSCSSSASGLGWILCPAANFLNSVLSTFYGWMEQFMQINPGLFTVTSDSGESGVHSGWSIFRDIANVFFVIYILVMIISQVTGVGISNYGIKKNLPRVIVSAILINISYYLCVLAVDVSNIVGASIKDLFVSFSATITVQQTGIFAGMTGVDIATGIGGLGVLTAAGVGYLITQGATSITSGVALAGAGLLMGLISVLISAAIGVIGMFLVLAVRQGLVVICTVIAPLAIIAYTLPNTKNLYDRWWKIAKALILMYPICGFVIGAGAFASRIILSTGDDFWTVLIAAVVQVGPYFALPSLIRGSINAVGSLGNRIGKLAGGYDRAAQGAFRNAPGLRRITAYQGSRRMAFQRKRDEYFRNRSYGYLQQSDTELQEAGREARYQSASRTVADLEARQQNGGVLTQAELDQLSRARQELAAYKSFNRKLETISGQDYWEKRQQEADEIDLMRSYQDNRDYKGEAGYQRMQTELRDILDHVTEVTDSSGNKTLNYQNDGDKQKASALMRILLETPSQDKKVISMIHNRYDSAGHHINGALSDEGLKALNEIRMENIAIGQKFGQKARISSAYLDSVVGTRKDAQGNTISNEDRIQHSDSQIAKDWAKVLTGPADFETQSSSELRAYASGVDRSTATAALASQLFTDADKRQIIQDSLTSISDGSSTAQQQMSNYNATHEYYDQSLTAQIQNTTLGPNGFTVPTTTHTQTSPGTLNRPDSGKIIRMRDNATNQEMLMNTETGVVESMRRFTAKDSAGNEHVATGFRMPEGYRLKNGASSGMIDKTTMVHDSTTNITTFKYKDDRTGNMMNGTFEHENGEFRFPRTP